MGDPGRQPPGRRRLPGRERAGRAREGGRGPRDGHRADGDAGPAARLGHPPDPWAPSGVSRGRHRLGRLFPDALSRARPPVGRRRLRRPRPGGADVRRASRGPRREAGARVRRRPRLEGERRPAGECRASVARPRHLPDPAVRPDRRERVPPPDLSRAAQRRLPVFHRLRVLLQLLRRHLRIREPPEVREPVPDGSEPGLPRPAPRDGRAPLLRQQLLRERVSGRRAVREDHAAEPPVVVRGAHRRPPRLLGEDVGDDPPLGPRYGLLRRGIGLRRAPPEDVEEPHDRADARPRGADARLRNRPRVLLRPRRPGRS